MTGFADLHLHQFARLGFGGRVLAGTESGGDDALGSCRPLHGVHGLADLPGNIGRIVLGAKGAASLLGHPTRGYPQFPGWPRWDDVTHQAAPLSALRRAVDGGLRLIVMPAVNNELLGRLTGGAGYGDREAVELQVIAAKELEAEIDAQAGGPGRGWYRIAYSPAEARAAVHAGKLAVVLGAEVDRPVGPGDIAAQVRWYHALGVRHMFPIHLWDNCLGGAAFALSLHWSRGHLPFSRVNPFPSLPVSRMDTRTTPGYGHRAGHGNARGLTPAGEQLVRELMGHAFMIDADHLSAASRAGLLRLTGAAGYPVVSGHTELTALAPPGSRSERQLTDAEVIEIGRHGGIVAPLLRQLSVAEQPGTAAAFLAAYRHVRRLLPGHPIALGSDLNGFAGMPGPGTRLSYPFPAPLTGAPMGRARLGDRTFDLAEDGVAHVGLLPDLLAALREAGLTGTELAPMLGSALGYVESWERAVAAA